VLSGDDDDDDEIDKLYSLMSVDRGTRVRATYPNSLLVGSEPAKSRTRDLSITNPVP